MLYYNDIEPWANNLTAEKLGELMRALLAYSHFGALPEFDNADILKIAWETLKPKLDADNQRYVDVVTKRAYAAYVREAKKSGKRYLPLEEWATSKELTPDAAGDQQVQSGGAVVEQDEDELPF